MMVGNRNKLLRFLRQREPERYKALIERLGLRR
jgi:ribosomal protein S15P/S13E